MDSTTENKPSIETLKANMDKANAVLQKAVRKALRNGQTPEVYKAEKQAASAAYRAYWSAVDEAN